MKYVVALWLLTVPMAFGADRESVNPPVEEQRAELLERIDTLQRRIPKDLRSELAIISMKLATGHCSPYRVKDFEDALAALPKRKQRRFREELDRVRSHPLWPSLDEMEGEEKTP